MTHRPEPLAQERKVQRTNEDVTGPAIRISGTRGTMFCDCSSVHGFLVINRDYVWYVCSGTACDAAEIKLGNRDRTKIDISPDTEKKIVKMALEQHPPKQQQPASWPMGSSRKQWILSDTIDTLYTDTHAHVHTYMIHQSTQHGRAIQSYTYREKEQTEWENCRNEGACFSLSSKKEKKKTKKKRNKTAIRIFGEMSMASIRWGFNVKRRRDPSVWGFGCSPGALTRFYHRWFPVVIQSSLDFKRKRR